jgi:hypothetical protein
MRSVPVSGPLNWVEAWNRRAEEFAEAIRKDQSVSQPVPKVLPWKPETSAEPYLAELKIRKGSLRNQAQRFEFKDCKVKGKDLLPWPII